MSEYRFSGFRDFWPFYLSQHLHPVCRGLHYLGTLIGLALLGSFLVSQRFELVPLAFVPGYAFAWVGHFGFERNRPATFRYPLWSFFGDFFMLWRWFRGKIKADLGLPEVLKYQKQDRD